jgi:hypothetical protein
MKRSIFLFTVLMFSFVFSAQADIKFGVKTGINIANASFDKDVLALDNFTGFQTGVIADFTLPIIGWGMDAALMYSQQGLNLKNENKDGHLNTLLIPVNMKFKMSLLDVLGAYLATGPCATFSFAEGFSGLKDQFETKSFGVGWNFGFGVEVLNHLQVGANYMVGLTNDYKYIKNITGEDVKANPRGWSITAAYFF